MRVLLWAEGFWPHVGGGPQFSAELALALRDRGHEMLVVTRHDDSDVPHVDSFRGIPVHRFPFCQCLSSGHIEQLAELRCRIHELKGGFVADLVHTTSFGPSMLFQLDTSRARPAPLLVTLLGEENPKRSTSNTTLHRALQAADWVTAPSQVTLHYARKLVPSCLSRSSVVRVGTRRPRLEPQPVPAEAVLLCLGRLRRVKGFDLALAALPTILARYPSARLVVAGDGPERVSLERQAQELGVQEAVDFLGWVGPADVPALINAASILVMPSRAEAFPLVGLQAGFMARPVVAARVGGIPELVLDRETGLLFEPGDSAALAEAILRLLEHPEEGQRLGRAAQERSMDQFDFDRIVDDYEKLYHRIVSGGQAQLGGEGHRSIDERGCRCA